jgi:hypothetical protein
MFQVLIHIYQQNECFTEQLTYAAFLKYLDFSVIETVMENTDSEEILGKSKSNALFSQVLAILGFFERASLIFCIV